MSVSCKVILNVDFHNGNNANTMVVLFFPHSVTCGNQMAYEWLHLLSTILSTMFTDLSTSSILPLILKLKTKNSSAG